MIVRCSTCLRWYDDEFRLTSCPHQTFPANDGQNHFAHHPESYNEREPPPKGHPQADPREP